MLLKGNHSVCAQVDGAFGFRGKLCDERWIQLRAAVGEFAQLNRKYWIEVGDHAPACMGGFLPGFPAIDQQDTRSTAGELPCQGKADDSSADHDSIVCFLHGTIVNSALPRVETGKCAIAWLKPWLALRMRAEYLAAAHGWHYASNQQPEADERDERQRAAFHRNIGIALVAELWGNRRNRRGPLRARNDRSCRGVRGGGKCAKRPALD
jgi:hypothetical protein